METADRPSWLGDTLTDDDDTLERDVDNLSAEVAHLADLFERFVRESDRPPPDTPPAAEALAA